MSKSKYRLIKDTPFDEAGVELFNYGEQYGYASLNSKMVAGQSYPVSVVENSPDWFRKISDKPEKMIELSNGKKVSESTVIEALKALTN